MLMRNTWIGNQHLSHDIKEKKLMFRWELLVAFHLTNWCCNTACVKWNQRENIVVDGKGDWVCQVSHHFGVGQNLENCSTWIVILGWSLPPQFPSKAFACRHQSKLFWQLFWWQSKASWIVPLWVKQLFWQTKISIHLAVVRVKSGSCFKIGLQGINDAPLLQWLVHVNHSTSYSRKTVEFQIQSRLKWFAWQSEWQIRVLLWKPTMRIHILFMSCSDIQQICCCEKSTRRKQHANVCQCPLGEEMFLFMSNHFPMAEFADCPDSVPLMRMMHSKEPLSLSYH